MGKERIMTNAVITIFKTSNPLCSNHGVCEACTYAGYAFHIIKQNYSVHKKLLKNDQSLHDH